MKAVETANGAQPKTFTHSVRTRPMNPKRLLLGFGLVLLLGGQALQAQQSNEDSKRLADLRARAENGDAKSQCELGQVFFRGNLGVSKAIYKANDGTVVFFHGHSVVSKDEVEGVKWCRKAAEQDYAEAQYTLGGCYFDGKGVAKDEAEAVKWYRKAAEQNYVEAQLCLGWCYKQGQGVAKDLVEAYRWTSLAALHGNREAKELWDTLKAKMTPEQIAQAQEKLARSGDADGAITAQRHEPKETIAEPRQSLPFSSAPTVADPNARYRAAPTPEENLARVSAMKVRTENNYVPNSQPGEMVGVTTDYSKLSRPVSERAATPPTRHIAQPAYDPNAAFRASPSEASFQKQTARYSAHRDAPLPVRDQTVTPTLADEAKYATTIPAPPANTVADSSVTERIAPLPNTPQKTSEIEARLSLGALGAACVAVMVVVIVMTIIGVKKAHANEVIFFNSKWDLGVPLIPICPVLLLFLLPRFLFTLAAGVLGPLIIALPIVVPVVVLPFALFYNAVQSFSLNWRTKWLALCVMMGRTVIGFLVPVWLVFRCIGYGRGRNANESDAGYAARSAADKITTILAAGVFYGFLMDLVNGEQVRHVRSNASSQESEEPGVEDSQVEDEHTHATEDEYQTANDSPDDEGSRHDGAAARAAASNGKTPYEVLGISPGATQDEIKAAYRRRIKEYHPDKVAHLGQEFRDIAERMSKEINAAYAQLVS